MKQFELFSVTTVLKDYHINRPILVVGEFVKEQRVNGNDIYQLMYG